MKYFLLAAVAGISCMAQMAKAATDTSTGTLMQINGVDVSGTTENIWYFSGGTYTALTSTRVNTTVAYGPYAYSALFYLPHNIPTSYLVVTNQAGTVQTGFTFQQVTPVGTVVPASTPTTTAEGGNVGGTLLNISGNDVSGTTEYVWSHLNDSYYLLGSTTVNIAAVYDNFAYNTLVYLPVGVPLSSIVVTNQASVVQQGYSVQLANPLGTATKSGATLKSQAATLGNRTPGQAGQLMRAYGVDVSGTTEFVWSRVGTQYVLLAAAAVNATDPRNQYRYNALFFLPKGRFVRDLVITNQAGTIQKGGVVDGKLPAIVASGG